ncbi:MAG: histidinol dehydrogenase [Candidatus Brockarchaeota archaeon]|nr:histidinol dehydrogenase [Candidatus Brockarchaeota archaeon]
MLKRVGSVLELARPNLARLSLGFEGRGYVERIVLDVAERGDEALLEYTAKPPPFDNVRLGPEELKVAEEEIEAAAGKVGEEYLKAMRYSIRNLERVSRAQLEKVPFKLRVDEGVRYARVARPMRRVGIVVPGGLAPYPSSLLMAAVPALVAGVEEIAVCTPPKPGKEIHPAILAAARQLGLDEIYRCNLVAAVGAMAFGTKTIRPVEKIVGPGNAYVSAAKQVVSGFGVAIDMPAGPSELAVIADETADARAIAWDIMAQAEHSEESKVFLITTSERLAREVDDEITAQVGRLRRREIARRSLEKNGFVLVVDDAEKAVEACNRISPEHVSIQTKDAAKLQKRVESCGTVLVGKNSACAIADYASGSSHILPTGGFASVRGGISVNDFIRLISIQEFSVKAAKARESAKKLAELEGLEAHALSIDSRMRARSLHNVYNKR